MSLPQFYHEGTLAQGHEVWLDEDTVRHVLQVLRMNTGEQLQLTNGQGYTAIATIATAAKKKCSVHIDTTNFKEREPFGLHLCVAFTKNASRNEWLLEKATELGVRSITPLQATRTERDKIRYDRWKGILISALLQSQQSYLPTLHELTPLNEVLERYKDGHQKMIGHCIDTYERRPVREVMQAGQQTVMLIGPEGDFTRDEVNLCMTQGYAGVSLGTQRLRTETAAIAVCAYHNMINI